MSLWENLLELDQSRNIVGGNPASFCKAIDNGADLRIYTEFKYNEHIEPGSDNPECVEEVSDFRLTYLLEKKWVAGIMNLRVPVVPPDDFGQRISMSFFMYNQDGKQAIARPYLDGAVSSVPKGKSQIAEHKEMPKYHQINNCDAGTNAPGSNFVYDFDVYRFFVRDDWRQVYSNCADGSVISGSLDDLVKSFANGCEIKVAISNPWPDLNENITNKIHNELFIHAGPGYYNTEQKIFSVESQPAVRVKPEIPMQYASNGWDLGWFLLRSDGIAMYWRCDPYTLKFDKINFRFAMRWFVK